LLHGASGLGTAGLGGAGIDCDAESANEFHGRWSNWRWAVWDDIEINGKQLNKMFSLMRRAVWCSPIYLEEGGACVRT
jgi:hypothetical protein